MFTNAKTALFMVMYLLLT